MRSGVLAEEGKAGLGTVGERRGGGGGDELHVLNVRVGLLACRAWKGSIIIGRRGDGRKPL